MLYTVIAVPRFEHEMKYLAKKYASLKDEYKVLVEALEAQLFFRSARFSIFQDYQKWRPVFRRAE